MRNIFTTTLMVVMAALLPSKLFATEELGGPAEVWTEPYIYALDEEVEWYFDMTGSGFEEGKDLYLWAWSPSEPDAGNFDESSDFAKLEYVGDMVWKMVITPSSYFGMSVEDMENSAGFWMRLKYKDNSYQSDVINMKWTVAELNSFKESGKAAQIFPERFYLDEPLTILVNAKFLWVNGEQGGMPADAEIFMHSGLNNFADGTIVEANMGDEELKKKTKLKYIGDGIYKMDLVPREYYSAGEDFVMENIECLFPSLNWAQVGADENGNFVFYAPEAIIPPDPVFSYFPQKFSQYDILTLTRKHNESSVEQLTYFIKAGDRVIEGEFEGPKAEMRGHINLLKETAGLAPLGRINLVVKDQNDRKVVDMDIPLVDPKDLN